MLQQIKKWAYNGVEYPTEGEAALAAFRHKLNINHEDVGLFDQNVRDNAGDLINLLSVFTRKATRS